MRRAWMLIAAMIALGGCRQIFGIEEPLPSGSGQIADARSDTNAVFHDSPAPLTTGLAMYVENGVALWSNDQPPDVAWALTDPQSAKAGVWSGDDLTVGGLLFDGDIDGQSPFSAWLEGQVYAPEGMQQVQVTAADYAFFDVELIPNSGSFQHVVTCRNSSPQTRTISVPVAGWYRVRVGWATQPSTAEFDVLHEGPADPSIVHFNSTNLRH